MNNLMKIPDGLPIPNDDGLCNHLQGIKIPDVTLLSTSGENINLNRLDNKWIVLYCYPLTGIPNKSLPDGWDQIPGARGCTPQALTFKSNIERFEAINATVFGLSTQTSRYQNELKNRLNLSFELLSDYKLEFSKALKLPFLDIEYLDTPLIKRLTLVLNKGVIKKVFYPIFPPTENADEVLAWLNGN